MSTPVSLPESLDSRIEELERNIRKLRVVTGILIAFVVQFLMELLVPELLGGLALLAFMAAIGGGMVFFISAVMGLLECWSPSGRLDEQPPTKSTESLATGTRSYTKL